MGTSLRGSNEYRLYPGIACPGIAAKVTGPLAPTLKVATADQVNFASQQNAVPFLRELSIVNPESTTLTGLTVDMEVSPPFFTAKRRAARHVPVHQFSKTAK